MTCKIVSLGKTSTILTISGILTACAPDSPMDRPGRLEPLVDAPRLDWVVDSVPMLEVGNVEADGHSLHRVSGATRQTHGILVVNGGWQEVRLYSLTGELLGRAGQAGSGPGEFRSPRLIGVLGADSALVYDTELRRLSVICGMAAVCSDEAVPGVNGRSVGVDRAWVLFEQTHGANLQAQNVTRSRYEYSLVHRGDGAIRAIAEVPGSEWLAGQAGNMVTLTAVPMEMPPLATFVGNLIALYDGQENWIRVLDEVGTETARFYIPVVDSLVADAEFREEVDSRISQAPEARRGDLRTAYGRMSKPRLYPSITGMLADRTGLLWVRLTGRGMRPVQDWVVLDPAQGVEGYVTTPEDLKVLEVGGDYILGIAPDSMGVEYLRLHRLSRRDRAGQPER